MQNPFERFLSMFAPVRSGEGFTSVLLMIDVFLLLTAYYFCTNTAGYGLSSFMPAIIRARYE